MNRNVRDIGIQRNPATAPCFIGGNILAADGQRGNDQVRLVESQETIDFAKKRVFHRHVAISSGDPVQVIVKVGAAGDQKLESFVNPGGQGRKQKFHEIHRIHPHVVCRPPQLLCNGAGGLDVPHAEAPCEN